MAKFQNKAAFIHILPVQYSLQFSLWRCINANRLFARTNIVNLFTAALTRHLLLVGVSWLQSELSVSTKKASPNQGICHGFLKFLHRWYDYVLTVCVIVVDFRELYRHKVLKFKPCMKKSAAACTQVYTVSYHSYQVQDPAYKPTWYSLYDITKHSYPLLQPNSVLLHRSIVSYCTCYSRL